MIPKPLHLTLNYFNILEQYQLLKKGLVMIVEAVQRVEEIMEVTPGVEKGLDEPADLPPSGRMLLGGRPPIRDHWVPY